MDYRWESGVDEHLDVVDDRLSGFDGAIAGSQGSASVDDRAASWKEKRKKNDENEIRFKYKNKNLILSRKGLSYIICTVQIFPKIEFIPI